MRTATVYRLLGFALALALTFTLTSEAQAQPQWDREKGDCDTILMSTKRSRRAVGRVAECTELFLSYRDATSLPPKLKRKYRRGFSVLYYKGDEDGRENAFEALNKIGAKALPREIVFPDEAAVGRVEAACKDVPNVNAKREKKARAYNKKALRVLKKGKRARGRSKGRHLTKAITLFERAMKEDPAWLEPMYNASCTYALLKDAPAAVELLQQIKGRCGRQPRAFLRKAHTDRDFRYIKKNPRWRAVTGYVEILLLNGAGAEGEPHVRRIKRDMATIGRRPAFTGTDKHPRSKPLIYYKPAFKDLALQMKDVVGSQTAVIKEITFNTAIKKYNFDLYVVWGMPHRAAMKEIPKVKLTGSDGGGTDASGNPLDALQGATDAVGGAKGAVDGAAGTAKDATTVPF